MTYLQELENESISIIRETAAEFENPAMLYSIGKDSSVLLHLLKKAFFPLKPPIPVVHIDTKWKFKEMIKFRDKIKEKENIEFIIYINEDGEKINISPFVHGSSKHTDIMKTQALKKMIEKYKFDALIGGARRDEESSRSKERIFSFRNNKNIWDPKNQRPELWNIYNTKHNKGENIRVFPLSNWTELDIWKYIYYENIEITDLYFAKEREILFYENMKIINDDEKRIPKEILKNKTKEKVRFRTLGCFPLTGAINSNATNVKEIIEELIESKESEREGRIIDKDVNNSMEKKKKEGYF